MSFLKQTLILGLLVISITAFSKYSGQGIVTLTAPTGVTNIQWFDITTGTPVAISGATNATFITSTPSLFMVNKDLKLVFKNQVNVADALAAVVGIDKY